MIPLAIPNLTGNEKKYLINCIETTYVSTVGEYVNQFERMVATATGSGDAVAVSAGTTGLHAALTAAGVSYGDLVILPSFTFIASANAIKHCGAEPWLMDVGEDDWCLSPGIVKKMLVSDCYKAPDGIRHKETGKKVSCIMPVYTIGNIPDMNEFKTISDEFGISLVADAACAIGARFCGKEFGQLADLSVLSFNGNKTITCGGGGAVVGASEELLQRVRHLTTTARVWPDYDFDMVGFNYRMTNVQAAIGCAQMERLDEFVEKKRYVRMQYQKAFDGRVECELFPITEGSSCWFSGIIMPENYSFEQTKEIVSVLRDKGIDAKVFWKPIHLQDPYRNVPKGKTVVSDSIWKRIITLPCSTGITDDELRRVIDAVESVMTHK